MQRAALTLALGGALALGSMHACVESSTTRHTGSSQSGAGPSGVGPSSSSTGGGSFDKSEMLNNLGAQIAGTCASFATAADALAAATQSYATSLSTADRDAARQAWRDAMDVWQRVEIMQVGPAGVKSAVLGGEDIRDEIYSWPLVNRCRVDQELVDGTYSDASAFATKLINVRGLDALEYLLFNDAATNACTAQSSINTSGSWNALTDLAQRRADYAHTAAVLVAQQAAALDERWRATGGNFIAELQAPSGTYADEQQVLNALSDAMFYLDTRTKDVKLAIPSGLSDCAADVCPEALESTFAGYSKQQIVGNLQGFQILFLGGAPAELDALGFQDLLVALGQNDLADRMRLDIEGALAVAEAIEEADLTAALATDPESVRDLYFAVKKITDVLKSDFVTVLDLNLPKTAEGDND